MHRTLLSPVDAAVLTGELAKFMTQSTRDGLAPGGQGWWDDGWAESTPWGFELSAISVPVLLLHGRQDRFRAVRARPVAAARIPGVDARLLDNDGHLTLIECRIGEVHAWLSARLVSSGSGQPADPVHVAAGARRAPRGAGGWPPRQGRRAGSTHARRRRGTARPAGPRTRRRRRRAPRRRSARWPRLELQVIVVVHEPGHV